jgi:hypothetical protein
MHCMNEYSPVIPVIVIVFAVLCMGAVSHSIPSKHPRIIIDDQLSIVRVEVVIGPALSM